MIADAITEALILSAELIGAVLLAGVLVWQLVA